MQGMNLPIGTTYRSRLQPSSSLAWEGVFHGTKGTVTLLEGCVHSTKTPTPGSWRWGAARDGGRGDLV